MSEIRKHAWLNPWWVGLLLWGWPADVRAAGDDKAAAEVLFGQGKALVQQHAYAEACAKLEASQALDSGIGTLLYLGDCYEHLGRTASAWAAFREAASLAAGAGQEQRRQVAETRARALQPRLVTLAIAVAPENMRLPGFELRRDGVLIPKAGFGVSVPVDPGEHTVVASAPNKRPYSELVTMAQESLSLTVPMLGDEPSEASREPKNPAVAAPVMAPPPARRARDAESPPPSGRTQRAFAYAVGIVGLAGVGIGSYFGVVALDRNSKSKDQCRPGDPSLCNPRGVKLRSDAQSAATVSTIAFIAGGTLFATSIVLWLTAPSSAERKPPLAFSTSLTPTGPTIELGGRW